MRFHNFLEPSFLQILVLSVLNLLTGGNRKCQSTKSSFTKNSWNSYKCMKKIFISRISCIFLTRTQPIERRSIRDVDISNNISDIHRLRDWITKTKMATAMFEVAIVTTARKKTYLQNLLFFESHNIHAELTTWIGDVLTSNDTGNAKWPGRK